MEHEQVTRRVRERPVEETDVEEVKQADTATDLLEETDELLTELDDLLEENVDVVNTAWNEITEAEELIERARSTRSLEEHLAQANRDLEDFIADDGFVHYCGC